MNRAILVGRLARNPELKATNSGMSVCRFTVAVDRRSKSEEQATADFISCVAFGKTGETINQYLSKGRRIALEGHIQTGSYTTQDGSKRYTTDVIVDRFDFIDSRNDAQGQSNQQQTQQQQGSDDIDPDFHLMADDDDLPF